jgi:hypothetical protein
MSARPGSPHRGRGLPLLGTGKTDYAAVLRLIKDAARPLPAAEAKLVGLAAG